MSPVDEKLRITRPSGKQKEAQFNEQRSEFQRDLDRVIYDYYFRRLGQITQVSSGSGRVLLHNRMTHSLKVAQVGRRLVQYLNIDDGQQGRDSQEGIKAAGGIHADVVDAAGLLHDIGHPPFGHVAEAELNAIAKDKGLPDGFEGNAQTFRIIMSLATHYSRGQGDERDRRDTKAKPGMDLTGAVTAACVKYPWDAATAARANGRKWGFYDCDRQAFDSFVAPLLQNGHKTLEAAIMDWADDITYAVHDLQDFYTDGVLPLHRLKHVGGVATQSFEMGRFWDYAMDSLRRRGEHIPVEAGDPRRMFAEYAEKFPDHSYDGTNEDRAVVAALASEIISNASKATSVTRAGRLHIEPKMRFVVNVLKQITWYYVIDRPELVSVQIGQRRKIRFVFESLFAWAWGVKGNGGGSGNGEEWVDSRRLPVDLDRYYQLLKGADQGEGAYGNDEQNMIRAVIDYIASMTEAELEDMYVRLSSGGHLPSSGGHRLD